MVQDIQTEIKSTTGASSAESAVLTDGLDAILREVAKERVRQDVKWGGSQHDDHHTTAEFVQLIQDYAAWARTMSGMCSHDKAEQRLVQVAALAVAAIESSRRKRIDG